MGLIGIENLGVTFRAKGQTARAAEEVNLSVATRESFGLVGESGSGRSTIPRATCRPAPVTGGRIRIAGQDLAGARSRNFAAQVQMVCQDPCGSLHPRHTIDRILSEPPAIHGIAGSDARISKTLADAGLPAAFRFRCPHQLSDGERRRVAVAGALIPEPEIPLLDGPTSAPDAGVQAEVLDLLARMSSERGLTFLMVSHDLAVIDNMCDRPPVMLHGRAVEEPARADPAAARMGSACARTLFEASADRMLNPDGPRA